MDSSIVAGLVGYSVSVLAHGCDMMMVVTIARGDVYVHFGAMHFHAIKHVQRNEL